MAYEYALVHVKFTIPLAILLTVIAYPFLHRTHALQITSLVIVAFLATLPWDAYLIRRGVWTYPPEAIVGPRLWGIPAEELFFFVIQTYITSMIYVLVNKPLLHPLYLQTQQNPPLWVSRRKLAGQAALVALTLYGGYLSQSGSEGTYLGLILVWALPFVLLIWTVAGRFIIALPKTATLVPILVPTIYLWLVDELALGRGTWSIASGTKMGACLFGALEIEEAVFFLVTNTLIVLGMAVFDQYLAIIHISPHLFPKVPSTPTPLMLLQSRMLRVAALDMDRIRGLEEAVTRLRSKSRSFYLANWLFSGRLRIDLILLYSFCRTADDLVDDASSAADVLSWTSKLRRYLDLRYDPKTSDTAIDAYITDAFPPFAHSALCLLPTHLLPAEPLYLLLDGFDMDAQFSLPDAETPFPIVDTAALVRYSECVAGTVGELCVALILHHCQESSLSQSPEEKSRELRAAARLMGVALQHVNIARDIVVDADIGRVYLPTTWLLEETDTAIGQGKKVSPMTPERVIEKPHGAVIERLRARLLREAGAAYTEARPAMKGIPLEARGAMVAAVEAYMEIGRVLSEQGGAAVRGKRATVPKKRRLTTVLKALFLESK